MKFINFNILKTKTLILMLEISLLVSYSISREITNKKTVFSSKLPRNLRVKESSDTAKATGSTEDVNKIGSTAKKPMDMASTGKLNGNVENNFSNLNSIKKMSKDSLQKYEASHNVGQGPAVTPGLQVISTPSKSSETPQATVVKTDGEIPAEAIKLAKGGIERS